MTTFAWPSVKNPQSALWELRSNTQIFTSPLSQQSQTVELAGAKWYCSVAWNNLSRAEVAPIQALFYKMRGMANTVYLPRFGETAPIGSVSGSITVSSSTGSTVTLSSSSLSIGDFIQFENYEVKMIVGKSSSTYTIEPPFRTQPSSSSAVTYTNPSAIMRLDGTSVAINKMIEGVYSLTAGFLEAI
jgi:hypothetical protein